MAGRPVNIKSTRADGDCFYSAIFRALKERPDDLLEKVADCLKISSEDETAFIKSFRKIVAEEIRDPTGSSQLYDNLIAYSPTLYEETVTAEQGWFRKYFSTQEKLTAAGADGFRETAAQEVIRRGTYVGQFEVRIVSDKLKACGIFLNIETRTKDHLTEKREGLEAIHLLYDERGTHGPSEHYLYYSFQDVLHKPPVLDTVRRASVIEKNRELIPIRKRVESDYVDVRVLRRDITKKRNINILRKFMSTSRRANQIAEARALLKKIESHDKHTVNSDEDKLEISPCSQLYDPCTKAPLFGNQIEALEERLKILKKEAISDSSKFPEFPEAIDNRLKLLLHFIQSDEPPTYSIFQYKRGGNENFGTSLFEAYWDIALALGTIDAYKLSIPGRYMVNSKVEDLKGPLNFADKTKFISNDYVLKGYLEKRKVIATNEQGASDITIAYKKQYNPPPEESCLYTPPETQPEELCLYGSHVESAHPSKRPLFYLFSSKFFKKEKSVSKYDVERIHLAAKHLKNLNIDIKIPILANDKARLDGFIERALNRFVAEEIYETYGATELLIALNTLYERIKLRYPDPSKRTVEAVASVLGLAHSSPPLDFFKPRFHQIIAIDKICDAIKTTKAKGFTAENNKFLVGVLPRGGKTYIAGGIVEVLQPKIVLVILGAKSETIKQFTSDLFDNFQNFSNYVVVNLLDKTQDLRPENSYIIISSIELLVKESTQDTATGRKIMEKILSNAPGYKADLILYDEAHLKGTKGRGRAALGAVEKKKSKKAQSEDEDETSDTAFEEKEMEVLNQIDTCPIVFFTGTYRKPRDRFKIPDSNMIVWDYEDIQRGKSLMTEMEYFKTRFGLYVEKALDQLQRLGTSVSSIEASYKKFPELYLLTANFNEEARKELNPEVLDFPNLFALNTSFDFKTTQHESWHTALNHNDKLENILSYLCPKRQGRKYKSVIDRIDELAQMTNDRLRGISSTPEPGKQKTHSQIWFMPRTTGLGTLPNRMMAFSSLILKQEWFAKNFDIVCVYTKGKEHSKPAPLIFKPHGATVIFQPFMCKGKKTLKECLVDYEALSRANGRCLIILAQDKLKLGISLPCVDIVVLLDDNKDVDERIQKMYRVLTESDDKKAGFVVDMNYFRCVNAVIEYHILKDRAKRRQDMHGTDLDTTIQTVFRDLLAFDPDRYLELAVEKGSEMAETQIKDELRALVKGASAYSETHDSGQIADIGKRLNAEVEDIVDDIEFDEDMLVAIKLTKEEREREMKRQIRGPGKHVKKAQAQQVGPDPEPAPEPKEDESEKIRRAKQDIYKTILKFGAITGNISDIETYLKTLLLPESKSRQNRLDIYELLVRRDTLGEIEDDKKQDEIIKHFIGLLREKITDDSRGLFKTMKERINSFNASENFAEILEYITAHLAPKDKERHKYGEVFTPLTLVDEMLSKLPKDVWTNKDLKWLDPANGIGNFPIKAFVGQNKGEYTYLGLYEGLKKAIPDEKTRCKHIIEKMLYMIDINNKNNLIAKRLFSKLCPDAIPNIEQINRTHGFLADIDLKFPNGVVNHFDIIMGNPPFNQGAVRVAMVTNKTRKERRDLQIEEDKSESGFWVKFVVKALDKKKGILKPNGYLLFIHPITWFKPDRAGAHDLILSNQLLNIKIYKNDGAAQREFGGKGKISIAYYLLKNDSVITKRTHFEYADHVNKKENILLSTDTIIALNYNSIYDKVMRKCPLLMNTNGLKHKTLNHCDDEGEYKLITLLAENGTIKYINSSVAHSDQKEPKVIVGGTYTPIILFDEKGEYGLYKIGQRHYITGSNLDKIRDYFKTRLSTLILRIVKYEQDFIKPGYFPDVRQLDLETINDATLAKYFGFDDEERQEIEKMPAPIHPKEDKIIKITCLELNKKSAGENQKRLTRKIRK